MTSPNVSPTARMTPRSIQRHSTCSYSACVTQNEGHVSPTGVSSKSTMEPALNCHRAVWERLLVHAFEITSFFMQGSAYSTDRGTPPINSLWLALQMPEILMHTTIYFTAHQCSPTQPTELPPAPLLLAFSSSRNLELPSKAIRPMVYLLW